MKKILNILTAVILLFAFAANGEALAQEKKKKDKTETMKVWVSMTCENCKAKVEKNIAFEKGVTGLEADLPTKTVTITYRADKTSPEKLDKALQKLGFKTELLDEK
ncbi:MAG: heavy-metal-associated domain-containing protein [Bacteroidales bacterium]